MTNNQHGQVPEALRLAEQYDHGDPAAHGNAWKAAVCTELRRLAELEAQIEALSGVQALSAAPAIAKLRHLYQNMVNGAVRDTASAKRIAEGLLAPAIEALERATPPAEQQAAPKAAPGEQDDHQILAITTAYEHGVGKGHQAYNSGKEIANPYSPAYRCDLAWQYGYKEGKEQAQREAKAAPQQEAQEPVAWESTTPGYIKYITQARYEKFSPAVRRWYKPYRCSGCAERGAGFDACDMATAAAQGFRRGQAAAKQEG